MSTWEMRFQDGTLVVRGASLEDLPPGFCYDQRINAARGPADLYPWVIYTAIESNIQYNDLAKQWQPLPNLNFEVDRTPRDYQQEAVDAWVSNNRRGIVVLPTGSGKSFVAELCITITKRSTMIIVPTLDLVGQWYDRLRLSFQREIGILGGGCHEILPITVSTYDSAYLHLAKYGDQFCCLIFDEVHHLPAHGYLESTKAALAPFRLGLTATLERADRREGLLADAVGSVVYRKEIGQLSGGYLSDYETERIYVSLTEKEREVYNSSRKIYQDFVTEKDIYNGRGGWNKFIRQAARSVDGRTAFLAYQRAKKIAHCAIRKIETLDRLLRKEKGKQIIVFAHDNATVYRISRMFLVPCITHQTDIKERRELLRCFSNGTLPVIVTSRVLNEGVDVPSAEIAIVLSGTGTVREHVQRLGRILRPAVGKYATLYEIVTKDTTEEYTSSRRRRHNAYK
jgi:superfamily II DNA or RNA helicase